MESRIKAKSRLIYETPSCEIDMPVPFSLVIFGASGDLTKRKILPAVWRLNQMGLLPSQFFVLGTSRTKMTEKAFRASMEEAARESLTDSFSKKAWQEFSRKLYYCQLDYEAVKSYKLLARDIRRLEKKHETGGNRMLYLAVPPTVGKPIIMNLGASGLAQEEEGFSHVVIEKPFGNDLQSAEELNSVLRKSFNESQNYRIDHYLAKETVQNILMFRFANSIFEPLWNRRYIDHVQITVSETLGVEHRAGYYEKAGVIRDMFQNHMFQLLALTAMEPPSVFEADRVRDEKVKVFRSVRPFNLRGLKDYLVLGQYDKGEAEGRKVPSYRDEPGVSPDSTTPTYAAMKIFIDNWRWNGVPFYLRSGKRLKERKAEISIHYRQIPHLMFSEQLEAEIEANSLVLRIQPEEGVNLLFQTKNPGSRVCLNPVLMEFSYAEGFQLMSYERVLLDCMQGDKMLFVREDGVRETWRLLTPLLEKLEARSSALKLPIYGSGSQGPAEADRLIEKDGRKWRLI
jgi:glucose-6-phosphate 1-dehydrogenase